MTVSSDSDLVRLTHTLRAELNRLSVTLLSYRDRPPDPNLSARINDTWNLAVAAAQLAPPPESTCRKVKAEYLQRLRRHTKFAGNIADDIASERDDCAKLDEEETAISAIVNAALRDEFQKLNTKERQEFVAEREDLLEELRIQVEKVTAVDTPRFADRQLHIMREIQVRNGEL